MKALKFLSLIILLCSINSFSQEKSFEIVEEVPVFPKCKGENEALKKCFTKMFKAHFMKIFNMELVNKLDLNPGKIKISIFFRINKEGIIDRVSANAPHEKLIEECKRVINLLPKMIPGKLKGKPVSVKYSIPFSLIIDESKSQKRARKKKERIERRNKN